LLDIAPLGQRNARNSGRGYHPQEAALIPQRIFEHERIRIQHFLLDAIQSEGLWVCEGTIPRTANANLAPQLIILGSQAVHCLFCRFSLLGCVLAVQDLHPQQFPGIELRL
jgi:hypothetical protein